VDNLRHFGIKAKNFKCFEDWQGFDAIYPVNVIVGRNNAGKSALLDLVMQAATGWDDSPTYCRNGKKPERRAEVVFSADVLDQYVAETRNQRQSIGGQVMG